MSFEVAKSESYSVIRWQKVAFIFFPEHTEPSKRYINENQSLFLKHLVNENLEALKTTK